MLVGGPDVRFLRLGEPPGGVGEAPGMQLALPRRAVSSAAWSPDGHLFALATQARPQPCCSPRILRDDLGFWAAHTRVACCQTLCSVLNCGIAKCVECAYVVCAPATALRDQNSSAHHPARTVHAGWAAARVPGGATSTCGCT